MYISRQKHLKFGICQELSEIWLIWIRKSHAFDLIGKVGRYISEQHFLTANIVQFVHRADSEPLNKQTNLILKFKWICNICDTDPVISRSARKRRKLLVNKFFSLRSCQI